MPTDSVDDKSSSSDGSDSSDESSSGDEPDSAWQDRAVEATANEIGTDREEVLKRAIIALAESEGVSVPDASEVESIRSRVDDLDADVDEKVTDLRERFVSLYRDLESKAPADHAHEETADRLDSVAADLNEVATELDSVGGELDSVEGGLYSVEEDLDAATDDLATVENRLADVEAQVDDLDSDKIEDKLSRVASAVLRARRRLEALETEQDDRQRLDALMVAANQYGVETAACGDCGETVRLGLLTTPECPHCSRAFTDLEPQAWFFGTPQLVVVDPPALDGDIGGARDDTADGAADDANQAGHDGDGAGR